MAQESTRGGSSNRLKMWTFWVNGPPSFTFAIPADPFKAWVEPLLHDGGRTVWKLFATEKMARDIARQIDEAGPEVRLYHEAMTDDQVAWKAKFTRLATDGYDFRTVECHTCYFLDLDAEGFCGVTAWKRDRVERTLREVPISLEALQRCPDLDAAEYRRSEEEDWDASL